MITKPSYGISNTSFSRRRESRVDGRGTNPPSHSHQVIPSTPLSFRAQRGISPFAQRKGARGMPPVILAKARIQRERDGKIMAIFPPSRQSWFKTSPLRIHTTSFRAPPGPFAPRKGARGMPTRHSREGENPEEGTATSWQSLSHHGNHGSKPPPFAKRKGPGGCPILSILYIHVNFSPENS